MPDVDEELDEALRALLSYLKKHPIEPGAWTMQVMFSNAEEVSICLLDGGPEDPIMGLEEFGRAYDKKTGLKAISVIAETVNDELMITTADAGANFAFAIVTKHENSWAVSQKLDSAECWKVTNKERIPALAVWRGITSST